MTPRLILRGDVWVLGCGSDQFGVNARVASFLRFCVPGLLLGGGQSVGDRPLMSKQPHVGGAVDWKLHEVLPVLLDAIVL